MEMAQKRKRVVNTAYTKWTEAEKNLLIDTRIKHDNLFSGKNANQRDGWILVSGEIRKPAQIYRQQWQAVMRKYKTICDVHSGDGAKDDGPACDPSTWPFYEKVHNYAVKTHNYHPEMFLSDLEGQYTPVQEINNTNSSSPSSLDKSASPRDVPSTSRSSSRASTSTNHEELSLFEVKILQQNKKIAKNIASLMPVLGQMVKQDYPSIDVSQLLVESDSSSD